MSDTGPQDPIDPDEPFDMSNPDPFDTSGADAPDHASPFGPMGGLGSLGDMGGLADMGTFLQGLIHVGLKNFSGGRYGDRGPRGRRWSPDRQGRC